MENLFRKAGEQDTLNFRQSFQSVPRFTHCNPAGIENRITIDTTTYGRKCDGLDPIGNSKRKAHTITGREQLRFSISPSPPHRTDRVDYEFGG